MLSKSTEKEPTQAYPLIVVLDGNNQEALITTHYKKGRTPYLIALNLIRKRFNISSSEKIRMFSSADGWYIYYLFIKVLIYL